MFRHPDGAKVASPEQLALWMEQTRLWIEGIARHGQFVAGVGLLFEGSCVVHHGGLVTPGVFGTGAGSLGGYIIIKAKNLEEAAEFAKGSPVLQGDGNTVEVREIPR